jgi:hypothetical protein
MCLRSEASKLNSKIWFNKDNDYLFIYVTLGNISTVLDYHEILSFIETVISFSFLFFLAFKSMHISCRCSNGKLKCQPTTTSLYSSTKDVNFSKHSWTCASRWKLSKQKYLPAAPSRLTSIVHGPCYFCFETSSSFNIFVIWLKRVVQIMKRK